MLACSHGILDSASRAHICPCPLALSLCPKLNGYFTLTLGLSPGLLLLRELWRNPSKHPFGNEFSVLLRQGVLHAQRPGHLPDGGHHLPGVVFPLQPGCPAQNARPYQGAYCWYYSLRIKCQISTGVALPPARGICRLCGTRRAEVPVSCGDTTAHHSPKPRAAATLSGQLSQEREPGLLTAGIKAKRIELDERDAAPSPSGLIIGINSAWQEY